MVGSVILVKSNHVFFLVCKTEYEIQDLLVQTTLTLRLSFVIFSSWLPILQYCTLYVDRLCGSVHLTVLRNGWVMLWVLTLCIQLGEVLLCSRFSFHKNQVQSKVNCTCVSAQQEVVTPSETLPSIRNAKSPAATK